MAPLLLLNILRGGRIILDVGTEDCDRCEIMRRNHKQCLAQSPRAMYSASVVEKATVFWRRLFQQMTDPPRVKRYPVVDLRVSEQVA